MAGDRPRRPPRVSLEELLLRHGVITPEQLQQAKEEQKRYGGDLGRALVDLGFINEELLLRAVAHQLGIPMVDPLTMDIPLDVVRAVPVQLCERFGIIAVGGDVKAKTLQLATHDPANDEQLKTISTALGYKLEPVAALVARIERAIRRNYYGELSGVHLYTRPVFAATPPQAPPQHPGFEEEEPPPPPPPPPPPRPRARPRPPPPPPPPPPPEPEEPEELPELPPLQVVLDDDGETQPTPLPRGLPSTLPLRIELAALAARLDEVEDRLTSNPLLAGILARLERLEQLTATELQAIRVIADALVDSGVITREEYFRRMKQRS